VLELIVRAFDTRQKPAIFLEPLDDLFAVHADCTDLVGISNTKSHGLDTVAAKFQTVPTIFKGKLSA